MSLGGEVATMTAGAFSSKGAIAQAFSEIPVFAAFDRSYPGTINQMVEAAWAAGQVGATDSGMMTASRAVIASYMPELLAAASTDRLAVFAQLSIDQLRAARSVSAEACGLLLASELDITKILPPDLTRREMEWMLSVLEPPPITRRPDAVRSGTQPDDGCVGRGPGQARADAAPV